MNPLASTLRIAIRVAIPLAIIGGGVAVFLFLVKTKAPPKQRPSVRDVVHVEATRIEPRDYQIVIDSQGTVTARTRSRLIPQVAGEVIDISPNFRDGGFVSKGEAIIQIDPRDFETALANARANLAQAKLALALEEAQAEQSIQEWTRLNPGSEPSALNAREPQLAQARAAADSAKAAVEQAKRNLERTTLRAPYDGRILGKAADVGQYVAPGSTLGEIYAVDYAEIRLPLSNYELGFVDLPENFRNQDDDGTGPQVTLSAQAGRLTETWEGRIVRTEGTFDAQSRQLFAITQVDRPYDYKGADSTPLKVGRFVSAEIMGNLINDAIVIPRSAIRESEFALIVDDAGKLRRRQLDILWTDEEEAVIASGLQAGDVLVLTYLPTAVDGLPVEAEVDGIPLRTTIEDVAVSGRGIPGEGPSG